MSSKKKYKKSKNGSVVISKHKEEGKHSLSHDSIFKGKKDDPVEEIDIGNSNSTYNKDTIEIDKGSNYHQETVNNEEYIRDKQVKEGVYRVLKNHTKISFVNDRRKPSKIDFNEYFGILKKNLKEEGFTNVELFNELAVYFSDNLFNMFKLLDNNWRDMILMELQDHIGKKKKSKEVENRNIYEETEIEFKITTSDGDTKLVTGVVIEIDYENSKFKVNSYENLYNVNLKNITKILNNTKFKYNLNKLVNIDFL